MELFNLNKKKADFIKIKVEKLVDWNEPNGDGCVVSDKITKEGFKVGYMYREKPEEGRPDSGWRFLSDIDTDEYLADANNSSVCTLNTVIQIEPAILSIINLPIGTDAELIVANGEKMFVDTNSKEPLNF